MNQTKNSLWHHIGVGAGFAFLILWFMAGKSLGVMELVTKQLPQEYSGAGVMIAIILMMTPGFYLWTLFNRWLEKKLEIKGQYLEDEYYKDNQKLKK